MIELDGSSGGGQILRTALALSALTKKPFKIVNIRSAREQPGLKQQHYTCVKALAELTNGKTDAELGGKELSFIPTEYKAQNKTIDIGTAGSITLLLQSILIPAMFSEKKHTLTIKGGTDVKWSMPIDYFVNVLMPQCRRFADIDTKILQRGYYPKGGGEVKIKITPKTGALTDFLKDKKIQLTEQGELIRINGISHASKDLEKAEVAERQAKAARQELIKKDVSISKEYRDTLSTGSGIALWATFSKDRNDIDYMNPIIIGADALGERGIPAEEVGKRAAQKLLSIINSKAATDEHLADNLIPLMALCPGSEIRTTEITQHIKTNIMVTKAFLGADFEIEGTTIRSKISKEQPSE